MRKIILASVLLATASVSVYAESGIYIGAGVGQAESRFDSGISTNSIPPIYTTVEESDTAYNVFVGYRIG